MSDFELVQDPPPGPRPSWLRRLFRPYDIGFYLMVILAWIANVMWSVPTTLSYRYKIEPADASRTDKPRLSTSADKMRVNFFIVVVLPSCPLLVQTGYRIPAPLFESQPTVVGLQYDLSRLRTP